MGGELTYLIFGGLLCAALAAVGVHYFRGHRKAKVEGPKYRMLEDDDR